METKFAERGNMTFPKQQKTGRIKRSDLNKIFPQYKVDIENKNDAVSMLRHLIEKEKNGSFAGFDAMTIRTYCKFHRMASEIFFRQRHDDGIDDVEYYRHQKFDNLDGFDPDSVDDFRRFASGGYGELGLSRISINVIDHLANGNYLIVIDILHSTYFSEGIELAFALYNSGIEFVMLDAGRILSMLEGNDYVYLIGSKVHENICTRDGWSSLLLPDIAVIGHEDEMTVEQYEELVEASEWE